MLFNLFLWTKVPRKALYGSMRVLAYGVCVSAGLGVLTFRSAVADVEDKGLMLGRQLTDLADLLQGANEFRLNNQRIFFGATTTKDTTKAVLDRFEAHCNKAPAFNSMEWKSLGDLTGVNTLPPHSGMNNLGVVRKEDGKAGDGMVMCFVNAKGGGINFFEGVRAFENSGDLHDMGDLRYVHVSPRKEGGSFIRTIWTDGPFDIRAIMGTPGQDSIGSDPAGLPRPANATRRFTAEAVGTPYSARIYQTSDAPEKVLGDYNAIMDKEGWFIINSPYKDPGEGRWYTRGETGEQSMISLRREGDKTTVVVGALGVSATNPKAVTK